MVGWWGGLFDYSVSLQVLDMGADLELDNTYFLADPKSKFTNHGY